MRRLYEPLIRDGSRLIETDMPTAELAKHACNAFLALKISFANALARLCERAGADVTAVVDVMGSDPRIGRAFLDAGLGYGGFCFPKDLQAFERLAARLGYDFPLLREVERINGEAVEATFDKVKDALWNLEDKRIALLGLSFKPNTDDVRFSPALALARRLLDEGAAVVGYDPRAGANAKSELPGLEVASSADDAMAGRSLHGGVHRLGRVPLARSSTGEVAARPSDRRGRAEPVRTRRDEDGGLRLLRDRAGLASQRPLTCRAPW